MKKIILSVAIVVLTIVTANAQQSSEASFKPFKFDVSFGYALPGGSGGSGGALFALEPKYAVAPNISVGLRIEAAVMISGTSLSSDLNNSQYTAQASASYLATGDYYFKMETFKPFVGAGVGLFTTAGLKVNDGNGNNNNVKAETKFGGMVRAGFEYGHFRLGVEYNLVGQSAVPANGSSAAYNITNSYLGIKLGVLIGGGRK